MLPAPTLPVELLLPPVHQLLPQLSQWLLPLNLLSDGAQCNICWSIGAKLQFVEWIKGKVDQK